MNIFIYKYIYIYFFTNVKDLFREFCFSIFSRPPTWPVPDIDDIRKTLTCLIEFWNSIYVDKKNMRNFAISASLESLQEIQDTNSLNAPLYQYRLQTDTLQVWLPEFRHNFYLGISTVLFLFRSCV